MRPLPYGDPSIVQIGKGLGMDRSRRITCPECGRERSCVVSRNTRGVWIRCFRCGLNAKVDMPERTYADLTRIPDIRPHPGPPCIPPDALDLLHPEAVASRVWITRAGLSAEDMQPWVKHHPGGYALLPVYWNDKLDAVVWRRLNRKRGETKYITQYANPENGATCMYLGGGPRPTNLVIVEDLLSMHRVCRIAPCMAICGTACTPTVLARIVELAPQAVTTWFDGDCAGDKARAALGQKLTMLGFPMRHVRAPGDPKHYTNINIKDLLEDAWRTNPCLTA